MKHQGSVPETVHGFQALEDIPMGFAILYLKGSRTTLNTSEMAPHIGRGLDIYFTMLALLVAKSLGLFCQRGIVETLEEGRANVERLDVNVRAVPSEGVQEAITLAQRHNHAL